MQSSAPPRVWPPEVPARPAAGAEPRRRNRLRGRGPARGGAAAATAAVLGPTSDTVSFFNVPRKSSVTSFLRDKGWHRKQSGVRAVTAPAGGGGPAAPRRGVRAAAPARTAARSTCCHRFPIFFFKKKINIARLNILIERIRIENTPGSKKIT